MRAALYARVSAHDQQTLSMQMKAMQDYATNRGWEIGIEVEETSSGAKKREKREEIIQAARRREIDVILVWKLDRWGRSLSDLVTGLQDLTALGVGFVSITEALDFTTCIFWTKFTHPFRMKFTHLFRTKFTHPLEPA